MMKEKDKSNRHFGGRGLRKGGPLALCAVGALSQVMMLAGCKKEATPETVVEVQAAHPELGSISEHITTDAILAPLAQAAIEPKITAPVKRFLVERGSRVKKGQLLAILENNDLAAAALDSKGSYIAAQATYSTTTKAQVPEDAQKAELDLAQAKANLDLNESIVKSRKELFAEGAIPGRDLDTAEAALVQAQAAYDAAAKHASSMQNVSHEAMLKSAQGQLTSAEGKYKDAEAQLSYSEIRSPIDGVVTDRPLFAGETAAAGSRLLTVMDTSAVIAKTHLAQSLAQSMKVGDAASVSVPGIEKAVTAKVTLVSPALDAGSTTVEVWLRIENKTGALKVGTPVKVNITTGTVKDALRIPVSAILSAQDGGKAVMVIAGDGVAHRKPLTVGIEDGGQAQVTSGLSPSDMVITGGAYGLDEGTRVKIGSAADEAPAAGAEQD
jgi:RND family efflux transporter MFP subunit